VYARPQTLREAVSMLAGRQAILLGGGTDVFPSRVGQNLAGDVVDLSAIAELKGIREIHGGFRIGGGTTWTEIVRAPLPGHLDALKMAAREVGSLQIQNRGTIAGNLCNASPAADGVPPLLALDAEVELVSAGGTRRLPLATFMTGYRQTAIRPGEVLSAVIVPTLPSGTGSAFVKLGARRYLVISIVMAAAVVQRNAAGTIADARVAVGAASAVARRLPRLEAELAGLARGQRPSAVLRRHHLEDLAPIDDVRATAAYRIEAALDLVGRALDLATGNSGLD